MGMHIMSAATTVLHTAKSWLQSKHMNANIRHNPEVFIFKAGSELRIEERGVLELHDTRTVEQLSHTNFIKQLHAKPLSCIRKVPMITPDMPLSRRLYSTEVVEQLQDQSLHSIFSKALTNAWTTAMTTDDCEHFAWSLMDHVLEYPLYHPDGYVRGTKQFHSWRILIQKQYAVLLLCEIILADYVKKLRSGVCDAAVGGHKIRTWAAQSVAESNAIDPGCIKAELDQAEKEYCVVVKKLRGFRNEQSMLKRAFHRTMDMCMPYPDPELCSAIKSCAEWTSASLQPFNPGRKHKSKSSLVRLSKDRSRTMGLFLRAQKKRRRMVGSLEPFPRLGEAGASEQSSNSGYSARACHEIYEDERESVLVDRGAESTVRNGEDDKMTLDASAATLVERNIDTVTNLLSDMSVTNEEVKAVAEDLAECHLLTHTLDAMDEIDALIAGLEWEVKQVKEVCERIASVLRVSEAEGNLSVEENSASVPGQGISLE